MRAKQIINEFKRGGKDALDTVGVGSVHEIKKLLDDNFNSRLKYDDHYMYTYNSKTDIKIHVKHPEEYRRPQRSWTVEYTTLPAFIYEYVEHDSAYGGEITRSVIIYEQYISEDSLESYTSARHAISKVKKWELRLDRNTHWNKSEKEASAIVEALGKLWGATVSGFTLKEEEK